MTLLKATTSISTPPRLVQYKPPRIAMLLVGCAGAAHSLIPIIREASLMSMAAGILVVLVGFVIMMWAWWQFQVANFSNVQRCRYLAMSILTNQKVLSVEDHRWRNSCPVCTFENGQLIVSADATIFDITV